MVFSTWPTAEKTPLVLKPLIHNGINTLLHHTHSLTHTHSRDTCALMYYQVFSRIEKDVAQSQASRHEISRNPAAPTPEMIVRNRDSNKARGTAVPPNGWMRVTWLFFLWWVHPHPGKSLITFQTTGFCLCTHIHLHFLFYIDIKHI